MMNKTRGGRIAKPATASRGNRRRGVNDVDLVEQHLAAEQDGHSFKVGIVNQPAHHQEPDHQHQHHHNHDNDDGEVAFDAATVAQQAAEHAAEVVRRHQDMQDQQQEMDLNTAAILASPIAQDHPHSHHLGHEQQHHVDGGHASTESLAHQSGYSSVVVESALAKRLAREPGLRLAQQRRPDQALNLGRRSNVEALFAHIAGELAPVQCKNCHKGHGPWTSCVIVDGQMCGSCANCWFNASGARCSFHETRNPQSHQAGSVLGGGDAGTGYNMPPVPPAALGGFNFVSGHASRDPVVRYTIEQAMTTIRAADKKTRHMQMIEAAAKQLAFQVVTYEEALQQEQEQGGPSAAGAIMNEDGPP